jgi:hypothetical protein
MIGGVFVGDSSEYWKDIREMAKENKADRYKHSKEELNRNQVAFTEKDNGHFIILNSPNGVPLYDFWGTTGTIIQRNTKRRSRGIHNLIRFLKKDGVING